MQGETGRRGELPLTRYPLPINNEFGTNTGCNLKKVKIRCKRSKWWLNLIFENRSGTEGEKRRFGVPASFRLKNSKREARQFYSTDFFCSINN